MRYRTLDGSKKENGVKSQYCSFTKNTPFALSLSKGLMDGPFDKRKWGHDKENERKWGQVFQYHIDIERPNANADLIDNCTA